jgi:FtsZ-interacting cell division protein ZipA
MQDLPTQQLITIGLVIIAALVLVGAIWAYTRKRRTTRLRSHYGPEYGRVVSQFGDSTRAEREMERRRQQVSRLKIRTLTETERQRYSDQWRAVQARFVDDPNISVLEADRLVTEVLRAKGFPTESFDERLDDISASYPEVAANYREACQIVARQDRGGLTTEDLRRSMVLYRNLFEELFREGRDEELRRVS